ncbi:MAG TPA: alpha/beta fold hydrolase [Kofleriaceae bacterium]|nr:alpha/beta fold hydrolase [Kofleriaceae bacterium]
MESNAREAPTLSAAEFHAARRFVDTDFGRIAYVERGEGPVALFIHGAALNGFQWRHQLAGLSDIRRVIAPDSLGMGHTEARAGQPLAMKDQAAMFRAFTDALGVDRVDLVGSDSGGGAAQIFAARNPQRIRTLALTNCEVHDHDENGPASLRLREQIQSGALVRSLQAGAESPATGKAVMAPFYRDARRLPDEVVATYFRPLVQSKARIEQMLGYFAASTNRDLIEIAPQLRALDAPTLVLWGTADLFFPVKWAYWLRDNLPRVEEVVEIAGAPVFWPEEEPALLGDKLRAHWTRHADERR